MTENLPEPADNPSEILLYQTADGKSRIEVKLLDQTVWLSQKLMAELFQTTQQNISLHIRNVYEEGELAPERTHKKTLSVQQEGERQEGNFCHGRRL